MSTLVTDSVQVDTFKNKAGTREYGRCTAWVNFDGTGVPTIRDSLNVSSITDNGVGNYTVNFAQNMVNADYSVSLEVNDSNNITNEVHNGTAVLGTTIDSTQVLCGLINEASTSLKDPIAMYVQIFGGDA